MWTLITDDLASLVKYIGLVMTVLYVMLFWQRKTIHFGIIIHVLVVAGLLAGAWTASNYHVAYLVFDAHERGHETYSSNMDFVVTAMGPLLLLWMYQGLYAAKRRSQLQLGEW